MSITIAQIQVATAQHFGLSLPKLLNKRRLRSLARPRQVAMYLACELTESSLPQIGRAFDRHHATIIHAKDLIQNRVRYDKRIAAAVDEITRQLTNDPRQINLPFAA